MNATILWGQLITAHRTAQVARDIIRDKAAQQACRDQATQVLVIQTNRILDLLEMMSEQQLLTQINGLLNGRGR